MKKKVKFIVINPLTKNFMLKKFNLPLSSIQKKKKSLLNNQGYSFLKCTKGLNNNMI